MMWTMPLARVERVVERHAELFTVGAQRFDLLLRQRVRIRLNPGVGRDVVVLRREGEIRPTHLTTAEAKSLERLRRRHLMHEVEVDVQQVRLSHRAADQVFVPDLLGNGTSGHGMLLSGRFRGRVFEN